MFGEEFFRFFYNGNGFVHIYVLWLVQRESNSHRISAALVGSFVLKKREVCSVANILDYIKWRGDLSFTQDPPNAVDALVFYALSYIRYGGAVEEDPHTPVLLRTAAEVFFSLEDHESRVRVHNDLELLHLAAASVRFGYTKLYLYRDTLIPEQETQFAAMTFQLDDGSDLIAFRGTDYTLVGWK